MTEHKTAMDITETDKCKKLNSTSMMEHKTHEHTEHKTDMNITKIGKYKKLNYKVSKNEHTTDEDKKQTYTTRLKEYTMQHKSIQK